MLRLIGLIVVIAFIVGAVRSCANGDSASSGVTQHQTNVLGAEICTDIANGMTLEQAHQLWVTAGASDDAADGLTRAAVHDYCPQYTDRVG